MADLGPRPPHRPYAKKRSGPPSVTTVLDALGKPGLRWGAAKETAMFAVHHPDEWSHLDPDVAVKLLTRHHEGVWRSRADVGTAVHAANEAWCYGEDAIVTDETAPYIDGLEKFWNEWQPDTLAIEEVVRHTDKPVGYIGQRDWRCRLAGESWLLDIKTTNQKDPEKGLYPDSWRLQLAAYRHASEKVLYDEAGAEIGTAANPQVDRCGIVHLRGDGDYTLYEVQAGKNEWQMFLWLRRVWTWLNKECRVPEPRVVDAPALLTDNLANCNQLAEGDAA